MIVDQVLYHSFGELVDLLFSPDPVGGVARDDRKDIPGTAVPGVSAEDDRRRRTDGLRQSEWRKDLITRTVKKSDHEI